MLQNVTEGLRLVKLLACKLSLDNPKTTKLQYRQILKKHLVLFCKVVQFLSTVDEEQGFIKNIYHYYHHYQNDTNDIAFEHNVVVK
jgi:hypothetical protein